MVAPPAHSPSDDLQEVLVLLRAERASLDGLSRELEPEFVRLGGTIGDMATVVAKIAVVAHRLRGTVDTDGEHAAVLDSTGLFATVAEAVRRNVGRVDQMRTGLSRLELTSNGVAAQEHEFANAVTVFWMLKTAFRVEAAALSPAYRGVLLGLTSRMDEIHQSMRTLIGAQFARLAVTEKTVRCLGAELSDVRALAHDTIADSRSQVERERDVTVHALAPAAKYSEVVSKQAVQAAARANEVFVSLQYPDIVRQKVEHIVVAMDDICARIDDGLRANGDRTDAIRGGATAHLAARVIVEQLRDARAEIEHAGTTTIAGIGALLRLGETVLDAGKRLHRLTSNGLLEVRASAASIERLSVLHRRVSEELATAVKRLRADVLKQVLALAGDLSSDVLGSTQSVRMVALNASTQAIRVPGGRALEQLAVLTQANAEDVVGLTRTMVGRAKAMLSEVEALQRQVEELSSCSAREDLALHEAVLAAEAKVNAACDGVLTSFDGVESEFNRIRGVAEQTLRQVRFLETATHRLGKAEATMSRVVAFTDPLFKQAKGDRLVQVSLDELRATYTMERERAAHASATGDARTSTVCKVGAVRPVSGAASVATPKGADDFGDNVDLF